MAAAVVPKKSLWRKAKKRKVPNINLDIIINATGLLHVGNYKPERTFREINYDYLNEIFKINTFSPFLISKYFSPLLNKNHTSIIAFLSARLGSISDNSLGGWYSYRSSKAALNSYVKNISWVLAKQGIRINAVAPGNLIFEGSVWDHKTKDDYNAVNFMLEKEVALGRLGKIEEITNLVLFLSSNVSSFTTGSIFVSDGGQIKSWL